MPKCARVPWVTGLSKRWEGAAANRYYRMQNISGAFQMRRQVWRGESRV
jgi:hypothetical protein